MFNYAFADISTPKNNYFLKILVSIDWKRQTIEKVHETFFNTNTFIKTF